MAGAILSGGAYHDRADALITEILRQLETELGTTRRIRDVPDRVSRLRRLTVLQAAQPSGGSMIAELTTRQLRDLQVVSQLYSYRQDFATNESTFEHLAEMVDKYEEDLLGLVSARPRGLRRAYVRFGVPVPVSAPIVEPAHQLTATLQQRVQQVLGQLIEDSGPWSCG